MSRPVLIGRSPLESRNIFSLHLHILITFLVETVYLLLIETIPTILAIFAGVTVLYHIDIDKTI
jgi:hypothetical protein